MTELEKQAMELYSFPQSRKAYIKGYQDANQWVSVSEQMPIEIIGFYNCLVIRNDKQIRQARFNALMQRFQNMNFEDIHDSVTHWMPLPNKPLK